MGRQRGEDLLAQLEVLGMAARRIARASIRTASPGICRSCQQASARVPGGATSVLQRKALTPNDFDSLDDLAERFHSFERYYEALAKPFQWRFTRKDLDDLLRRMKTPGLPRDQLVA